jgi:hypothetical protein
MEKPLISTVMVRAILDDRKTQIRRIIKPQPDHTNCSRPFHHGGNEWWWPRSIHLDDKPITVHKAPYQKDDKLWVRETWCPDGISDNGVYYKADEECLEMFRWRPSIYMPRWASRITLLVKNVRVERVQDISPEDCEAEGITGTTQGSPVRGQPYEIYRCGDIEGCYAQDVFRRLWNSINAKRGHGWDKNDWVWVYDFERVK